jgi:hypothetical protein
MVELSKSRERVSIAVRERGTPEQSEAVQSFIRSIDALRGAFDAKNIPTSLRDGVLDEMLRPTLFGLLQLTSIATGPFCLPLVCTLLELLDGEAERTISYLAQDAVAIVTNAETMNGGEDVRKVVFELLQLFERSQVAAQSQGLD